MIKQIQIADRVNPYFYINQPNNQILLQYDVTEQSLKIVDLYNNSQTPITVGGSSAGNSDTKDNTAQIEALKTQIDMLKAKIDSQTKNPENVPVEEDQPVILNNTDADYVITSNNITQQIKGDVKTLTLIDSNITTPSSILIPISANVSDQMQIKDTTITTNNTTNADVILVRNAKTLTIQNVTFKGTTYNTIMTGQQSTEFLKYMLIDNCNFEDECNHINIWFAGFEDGAVLTISNCHFKTCEQFLCISDFFYKNKVESQKKANKLTVNIINCTIDNYDNSYIEGYGYDYAGIMFIESRNLGEFDALSGVNPFSKVTINIDNLIVKGQKITKDNFQIANGLKTQMMYFYHKQTGCIKYSEHPELFPEINIK